jgi:hypothetical protein
MTLRIAGTAVPILLLAACTAPDEADNAPWQIPARYDLVAVNGQPIPAPDTVGFRRVLSGAIEIYSRDSLRVIHMSRSLIMDRLPCQVLRDMGEVTSTAGLVAVTDTSTAGCEELRGAETDTQLVVYQRIGERLQLPHATAHISGDTLVVEDQVREVDMDGPTRIHIRSQRYVRAAASARSRKPQN